MPDIFPATVLGERFERAVSYAVATHRFQRRKSSGIPYVAHLLGVCALVLENGGTETEAIAALLHDAVEDHGGLEALAQIRERFGDDVAAIVHGCSDSFEGDPTAAKAPFYDRKLAYIAVLRAYAASDDGVMLVSAADKLYNARATHDDRLRGQPVFERFKGKKFGTLWYYRALADAYLSRDGRHRAFGRELVELVDAMAGKSVTAQELLAAFAIDDSVAPREKGSLIAKVAPT